MEPFFSIIIPVYNVEQYLEQCLDSIVNQGFRSWELICINDGSTDGSPNILDQYRKKHNQIRIQSIENSGTAVARNRGINLAKGQYLLFIDSDDWIEPDALQVIYDTLKDKPVDILSFNGHLYYEDSGSTEADEGQRIHNINGWEYYNARVLKPRKFHFVCVVIRAYRRSFFMENGLYFQPGILHEDNLFTPQIFYSAGKVAEIPDSLYYYRIRKGSKMHEYSYRQIRDKCLVNNRLGDFFFSKPDINLSNISRIIASGYISLYSIKVRRAIGQKQREITAMINREYLRHACITRRHKFLFLLIRLHPLVYRFYIRVSKTIHSCFQ